MWLGKIKSKAALPGARNVKDQIQRRNCLTMTNSQRETKDFKLENGERLAGSIDYRTRTAE